MKISTLKQKIEPVLSLLRCPLCAGTFRLQESSLCCGQGHCYDLSSRGYVNLAPQHRQSSDKYDEALFSARERVMAGSFYEPLRQEIICVIGKNSPDGHFVLFDAGCGEGTHTRRIAEAFPDSVIIAGDLSRAAVRCASKGITKPNWFCCDLTKLPLCDHSVHYVLDILTPADYSQFRRVLKPGGLLLKVVPGNGYLQEIREAIAVHLRRGDTYSADAVLKHLGKNVCIREQIRVNQSFPLCESESADFLTMTPMTFSVSAQELQSIHLKRVTIDMTLLVCEFA